MNPPTSRRKFLRSLGTGLACTALSQALPGVAASLRRHAPRSLVLIQLAGGNDGFNTLVPLHDEEYYRLRPTLALRRGESVPVDECFALNRAADELLPFFEEGKLALLPAVGFPLAIDSHHRANEIWRTASCAELAPEGRWASRCLAAQGHREALHLFSPAQALATSLHEVAQRVASHDAPEIYALSLPGFDTHYDQARKHPALLQALASALSEFQNRLARRGVAERVTTVAFSEFGRTLAENRQGGTDHGNPTPVFVLGAAVRGGVLAPPRGAHFDFRQVVASLAHDWLGVPRVHAIADQPFAPLPLFHSPLS